MSAGNFYTLDVFKEKANNKHNNLYTYKNSSYVSSVTKIYITCKKHGDFLQEPRIHLSGHGCPKCAIEKDILRRQTTFEDFLARARRKYGDKYTYFKNSFKYYPETTRTFVKIKCPKHGIFTTRVDQHLSEKSYGCPKCSWKDSKKYMLVTRDRFILQSSKRNHYRYNYDDMIYVDQNTIAKNITCPVHGHFDQDPKIHIIGQGCRLCNSSKGEMKILYFLNFNKTKFIKEYVIPGYRYRYDFYIPELNLLIEFDGLQHFNAIKHYGGEEGLKKIQYRDSIKNTVAENFGYRLLRLNYKQLKNLDVILANILNTTSKYKVRGKLFKNFLEFCRYLKLPGDATPEDYKKYLFKFKCPS